MASNWRLEESQRLLTRHRERATCKVQLNMKITQNATKIEHGSVDCREVTGSSVDDQDENEKRLSPSRQAMKTGGCSEPGSGDAEP